MIAASNARSDEVTSSETNEVVATESVMEVSELKKLSLEDLMDVSIRQERVTTLSRVEELSDESPGSVYVFNRKTIQERGYRSLGELLQVVPGFTVFHRDLQYAVGVRGLNANDNDKVSLLVNGQRVLGFHEQEFLNGPINLDNVERVEVVVGPSSLFQQANTLAATINVITRNAKGVEAQAATGTDLPYSGTLITGRQWADDRLVSFSFTLEQKQGFDAWSNSSRPFLPGRDVTGKLEWPSFFGVLNGQYGELSAQVIAYQTAFPELHIDGADPGNNGEYTEHFYSVLVKDEHPWTPELTGVLSFEAALKGTGRQNQNGPPVNAAEQVLNQRQYRAEAGLRYTGLERHLIQAGVQASYDDNFNSWFTFNDTSGTNNIHIPRTTLVNDDTFAVGFYVDDQYQVNERLKLIGGVRVDENGRLDEDRWFPGWRSAIVYHFTTNWISKVVFNRSVRMPSPLTALNEVWGSNNPDTPSKPSWADLYPTARNPEILTTVEAQNIFYLGNVRLAGTFYHQELKDFITWFQPHSNGGNFRGNGVELSAHATLDPSLIVWANAAWNDSELHLFDPNAFGAASNTPENFHAYVNPQNRLIGSATYTANAGFDWEMVPRVTLSPTVRYFTDQAGVRFRPLPDGPQYVTLRNRVYFDATISWRVYQRENGSQMNVRLSGYNLTDNRDEVAAQFFADTYRPRGIAAVLAVDVSF